MPVLLRAAVLLGSLSLLGVTSTPAVPAEAEPIAAPAVATPAVATPAVPAPFDHVVVVMLENKNFGSVLDNPAAPYLSELAARGAKMTSSYGLTHPSQPNYVALFSGSPQGITSDNCTDSVTSPNLGRQLLDSGRTFVGYAESMPTVGYTPCTGTDGMYMRKHNPWVNFDNLPATVNQPFSAFPTDYTRLPTVAFVTPNMCNDMHDCPVQSGDAWMRVNLGPYAAWATTHHSLLVVTFDENEAGTVNTIPTLFVGAGVQPGSYAEQMNHYTLLRTLEDVYSLPSLGYAADESPLTTIWVPEPAGVVNGGFENGLTDWVTSGTTATARSVRHGGSTTASAGAHTPTTGNSGIAQVFTVPRGKSTLSLAWRGDCEDKPNRAWATITLRNRSSGEVRTLVPKTCVRNGAWTKVKTSVTVHTAYTIRLTSRDDGKAKTPNITYLDDVKLS